MKFHRLVFPAMVIMLLLLNRSSSQAQHLWTFHPSDQEFETVDEDSSVDHLRELIVAKDPYRLASASKILAYNRGQSEQSFILENLRCYTSRSAQVVVVPENYFLYQLLLGYFGDTTALAGMDTVAIYAQADAMEAVMRLSDAGRFEHFQLVENYFSTKRYKTTAITNLVRYGADIRYEAQVKSLLGDSLRLSSDFGLISDVAHMLSHLDRQYTVGQLESRLAEVSGWTKLQVFRILSGIDPDGDPERAIEAIVQEQNDTVRLNYFPSFDLIRNKDLTSRYITPHFIKFAQDWASSEQSDMVNWIIKITLLRDFIPLPSSDSVSCILLLDSLTSTRAQAANYSWISGQAFTAGLEDEVSGAKLSLLSGDSVNCARQIKLFQQRVDEEYRDSLDGDGNRVTIEGWKFLYYNAQYILDRLPVPPAQFVLMVNVTGNGTVTKNPDKSLYDSASTVQLTATPGTGYAFSAWSGDASGSTNPLTVSMNSYKTITATFTQSVYTITATAGAHGSINPSGALSVEHGANQPFTITPDSCYHVDSLIVDGQNTDSTVSYTFTSVTSDHTIRAVFAIDKDTIFASAGPNGSIIPSGNVIVNCGDSLTFTTSPNTGYNVDSLIVDGVSQSVKNFYHFNHIKSNHTIRATFSLIKDTIGSSAGANGSINPSGTVIVNYGSSQHFSISPTTGYHVDSVAVDGLKTDSTLSYTFSNVTTNHTISVWFAINRYTITGSAGANGSITPSGAVSVEHGANQALTITPNSCYHIDSVIVNGGYKGTMSSYTFTNVRGDSAIRAVFKINVQTISATAGSNGTMSPSGAVSVNCGSNQTFTITPNSCYQVDSVIVNGTNKGAISTYTFTNVRGDSTIRTVYKIRSYTITATVGSYGTISPSGTVSVNCGSNQTFTVTPNSCARIDSVIVDGTNQGSITSYTFTNVTANHTIRATFLLNTPAITSFTPTSGLVGASVTIKGIRFTGTTSVKFNGTSVASYTVSGDTQITTTVPTGATTGTISVTNACGTGTSSGNFTIMCTLTISVMGSGTVSKSPDQSSYVQGTSVTLTANPTHYYVFMYWSGDATGSDNPITVVMNSNKSITARFGQSDRPIK